MLTGVARLRTLRIGLLTSGIAASSLGFAQASDAAKPNATGPAGANAPVGRNGVATSEPPSPFSDAPTTITDTTPNRPTQTPETVPLAVAPPGGTALSPAEPAKGPKFTIGAGTILWLYQPLAGEAKNNVEVFWANLVADGSLGSFGFHLEPRFRDSKLRPFFSGTAWLKKPMVTARFRPAKSKSEKLQSARSLLGQFVLRQRTSVRRAQAGARLRYLGRGGDWR